MSYSAGEPHLPALSAALAGERDFPLGIPGFTFADLYDARRLADLLREFESDLGADDRSLYAAYDAYRRDPDSLAPVERSNLLIRIAERVGRFVGRLFGLEEILRREADAVRAQDPVFVFKRDFLNQGNASNLNVDCVQRVRRPPFFLGPSGPDPQGSPLPGALTQ